jgi:hypothetical protein
LAEHHPDLVPRYRALYGRGSYAPRAYSDEVYGRVAEIAGRYRLGGVPAVDRRRTGASRPRAAVAREEPAQLTLL